MKRALALAAALAASGCGNVGSGSIPAAPAQMTASRAIHSPIQHVVVVIQENRSFDNFFNCFTGTACIKRGKEKVKQGSQYVDEWVTLTQHKLVMGTDIGHCYYSFVTAHDGGAMDGFNLEPRGTCPRSWGGGGGKTIGTAAYQYVNPKAIAPYWDLAKQYVLGDHMFQTQGSGSFTAHQDLIRGASSIDSNTSMIDTPTGMPWGCDATPVTAMTDLIVAGKWELDTGPYPCTNKFPKSGSYETLRDLLDAKQVSWKYYSPCFKASPHCGNDCTECAGALLNAFDVIAPVRYGSEWGTNVSMPQSNIFKDISSGSLPAVSWVVPTENDSDHPGATIDRGPEWVASVVNAIGESDYWSSTAIVVVWDDWGGLYDHVAPKSLDDQGSLGFRVPLLVVSPYAPQGAVSHTQYEFGSILKYIENNWGLGSLGTTDQRATSIINVFDYSQNPRSFTPIPSRYSIDFFRNEPPSSGGDPE